MDKLGKIKNIKNKKLVIIFIVIVIILISIFSINAVIKNITENREAEELKSFYWETKAFFVNDDYTYTFDGLVTIEEKSGIDTVTYTKDGKEITINGYGKQKIGIDYRAIENKEYKFKITPVGEKEKTETLNIKRKVAGEDTYKLVNGVYLNTPFLENFNSKYTRYLKVTDKDTLTPDNWIFDEEPENWYDYNNQKWANIYVEAEGVEGYYVWVPRYVYKLDQENQVSDVKFVDVYNNYIDATTGEHLNAKQLADLGYQLPEAFEFGDGYDLLNGNSILLTSISGYWISKYQLSELEKFSIDYNMTANNTSIVLSDFENNVSDKATKYTYAINGKIVNGPISTLDGYTFNELNGKESYIINVTALDENDSIVGSMTKILQPAEVNSPELEGFDKDTTFYVYWDENGIEHNEIPISESAPENWYNYTYSNWANILVRNDGLETYYVWIPRYQYRLNQTSQKSDVRFILGTGNDTINGYQIPEAFWWDKNDDGVEDEGEQLKGYWITKYQLSKEETTPRITAELAVGSDYIKVKDITGTELVRRVEVTEIVDGVEKKVTKEVSRPLIYEYYLNSELKHNGNSAVENYVYREGVKKDTNYVVNIIARDAETKQYVGSITKKVTTKETNAPDMTYFVKNDNKNDSNNNKSLKDRTYYVVYDGEEISQYIPITEKAPDNWYDYAQSKWANIVVTDGNISGNTITDATSTSYFVWIPRYQYKIKQALNDWSNQDISNARTDVKFINGTDSNVDVGYQIPEAFWWDKNDDGIEDEEEKLTGYWMSKYQLNEMGSILQSNQNEAKTYNISDWMMNIRKMEETGGAMGLAESIGEELTDNGTSNNIDIHMQKNTEYGAVAILSASAYGNPNKIEDGKTTTGNATGIVMKINGEWVAAGTVNYAVNYANAKSRYKNVQNETYVKQNGDAITETNGWHGSNNNAWISGGGETSPQNISGLVRAFDGSGSIFSYYGYSHYLHYFGGMWSGIPYNTALYSRAIIVSGEGF